MPASHQIGDRCGRWGYNFQWTDQHPTREDLLKLRSCHDELGAEALPKLQAIAESMKSPSIEKPQKPDFYAILRDNHENDEALSKLWTQVSHVPEWVDWEQLERGQKTFARYALANSVTFAFQAFIRESSASPGIAEVLSRTGGFTAKHLLSRVIETFTWLIHCTTSLESMQPGGEGHVGTVRVRLLHSMVRQRILKLAATNPAYYNTEKFGAPINDMDALHALSLFSCIPMWDSLPKMGIKLSEEEIADYVALFRYIAHVLGIPTDWWATSSKAKAFMESMYLYELEPNDTSRLLTYNFIKWIEDEPPVYISTGFIEAGSRWVNGHEICDAIGLKRPGPLPYAVFAGHNVIVSTMAFAQKLSPKLDAFMVKYYRNFMYNAVTHYAGYGRGTGNSLPYQFRFMPRLNFLPSKDKVYVKAPIKGLRPLESVFFVAFVLALCFSIALLFGGVKLAMVLNDKYDVGSWVTGQWAAGDNGYWKLVSGKLGL